MNDAQPILLCSDLDRTLIPNGPQPESPQARPLLRRLAGRRDLLLAYVSGRHQALLAEAIDRYGLPHPDFAIGDVGTSIYRLKKDRWLLWPDWHQEIGRDWRGRQAADLAGLFRDLPELRLQEPEKQNRFKLSYYTPATLDLDGLLARMRARVGEAGVAANLIWSVDQQKGVGLLDVLPAGANKLHAIRFLMTRLGIPVSRAVFAGDSGNDLDVLTSGLSSILVANASDQVRKEAQRLCREGGISASLYCARGGFLGMNGNYSGGVLEGVAHFFPDLEPFLRRCAASL